MGLNRRGFLRQLGLTVVSFGIVDRWFQGDVRRYAHALTTTSDFTGRKFALLIGINRYPNVAPLAGCLNDLQIQRQLLIHQFGFAPENIITLQDDGANRENILTTFQKDLQDVLTPEDFLLVHFSGYGTRLVTEGGQIPAIMPVDGVIGKSKATVNNAIAVSTIEGAMRSFGLNQGVLVLDTSFDPLDSQGHHYWRGRTYPKEITASENPSELALSDQIQRNLNQRKLVNKSLVRLGAAATGWGTELQLNNTSVGLFTLAIARYLTALNPTATLGEATAFLQERYRQADLGGDRLQLTAPKTTLPLYGVAPSLQNIPAVGHVMGAEGNGAEVFLVGYDPEILQAIAPDTEFQSFEATPQIIRLTGKNGVIAQGRGADTLPPVGTTLQEKMRVLPRNLTLKIALGNNLSRIERVDATSAFAGIVGVANVSNPPEWADYVFDAGYQLFSMTGNALPGLIPLEENEAIKSSVDRLQPIFTQLLALKWLRLLVNESTSLLPVKISLDRLEPKRTKLLEKNSPLSPGRSPNYGAVSVKQGEKLAFYYENPTDNPLHFVGFAQSPNQELFLLTPQAGLTVAPQQTTTIDFEWTAQRPLGIWQIYWVGGDRPFTQFEAQLDKLFAGLEATITKVEKPLPLIRAILEDLDNASITPQTKDNKEVYHLATKHWLTAQFTYRVTETSIN